MEGVKDALISAGLGGLLLGGNYVHGVALAKCIEGGYVTAKGVLDELESFDKTSSTSMPSENSESVNTSDEELFV